MFGGDEKNYLCRNSFLFAQYKKVANDSKIKFKNQKDTFSRNVIKILFQVANFRNQVPYLVISMS